MASASRKLLVWHVHATVCIKISCSIVSSLRVAVFQDVCSFQFLRRNFADCESWYKNVAQTAVIRVGMGTRFQKILAHGRSVVAVRSSRRIQAASTPYTQRSTGSSQRLGSCGVGNAACKELCCMEADWDIEAFAECESHQAYDS